MAKEARSLPQLLTRLIHITAFNAQMLLRREAMRTVIDVGDHCWEQGTTVRS